MQPARNITFGFSSGAIILACLSSLAAFASTPVSTYGTFFGEGAEAGIAVTTDAQGDVIVVGITASPSLPGTANAFQARLASGVPGTTDVFYRQVRSHRKKTVVDDFSRRGQQRQPGCSRDGRELETSISRGLANRRIFPEMPLRTAVRGPHHFSYSAQVRQPSRERIVLSSSR